MLDEARYKQKLNDEIAKQRIQTNSAKNYLKYIKAFNDRMFVMGLKDEYKPSSEKVEEIIRAIAKGRAGELEHQIMMIHSYSKLVLGNPNLLLGEKESKSIWKDIEKGKKKSIEPKISARNQRYRIGKTPPEVRLALKVQSMCGVRVAELSRIKKKDIDFDRRAIEISRDKGGGKKTVYFIKDYKIDAALKKHLENFDEEEYIFPDKKEIGLACGKVGIKSHDNRKNYIRRMFAERVEGNITKGMTKPQAKREALTFTQKLVGHSNERYTKLYLGDDWRKKNEKVE